MLVLPDADLDLVADSAINAGFGSAGERCMAISVLVAVGDVGDKVILPADVLPPGVPPGAEQLRADIQGLRADTRG